MLMQHRITQDGVDAGLVALVIGFQRLQNVGIDANRSGLLDGPVEGVPGGVFPEVFRQRRNVAGVNLLVGHGRQSCQLGLLLAGEGWQIGGVDLVFNGFLRHGVSFLSGLPFGQK